MKKITLLALILFFFTKMSLAGEVNVFSARHYDSDIQLYEKFTKKTGTTGQPYLAYGIVDFFINAIDDMMEQDRMISLRGREYKHRPLDEAVINSDGVKGAIKFLNVALPLLLLLIFGVIQYIVRRVKFARR